MKVLTGFTANTPKKLLLDAGVFFKDFTVGTDTYESARQAGKLIGATQGGGEFNATPDIRQIEVDGVKGRVKGLEVFDAWDVYLKANMLEISKDVIKMSLVASKETTVGNYTKIEPGDTIELSDYIDNITWVGTISGSNTPVIIQVYNTISMDGLSLTTADKSQSVVSLNFHGHYTTDGDNIEKPFAIFYPTDVGTLSLNEE